MRYVFPSLMASIAMLTACAVQVPKPPPGLNAGQMPTESQSREVVLRHLQAVLKDPDSLKQFEISGGPLATSWYRDGYGHDAGWMLCFQYNAKNSYGGYAGLSRERIVVRRYGDSVEIMPLVQWATVKASC